MERRSRQFLIRCSCSLFILPINTRKKIMSQETILVTGAAGGVGSTAHTAIATLLEQGHRVRAMVRKLDARSDTLRNRGAEVVVADMLDVIAVRVAMQGCSACISRIVRRSGHWCSAFRAGSMNREGEPPLDFSGK
jgi:NAD(P)-dependent dehydrogenase (short-subunit alcohol dehydrogenase family)